MTAFLRAVLCLALGWHSYGPWRPWNPNLHQPVRLSGPRIRECRRCGWTQARIDWVEAL